MGPVITEQKYICIKMIGFVWASLSGAQCWLFPKTMETYSSLAKKNTLEFLVNIENSLILPIAIVALPVAAEKVKRRCPRSRCLIENPSLP